MNLSIFGGIYYIVLIFKDRTVQPIAHLYYYTHTWGILLYSRAWNQFIATQGAMERDRVRAIILPGLMDDP